MVDGVKRFTPAVRHIHVNSKKWCFSRELQGTIFGTGKEEVTVDWRKRHNEENHYSYNIEEDQTGNACSMHGGEKKKRTRFW